jgi:metallo-beta-lactamase family protein
VNATEIYRLHPECFNASIYKFLRERENPFGMENLTYIREAAFSRKLNDLKEPAIIISASGMAEAGRIRHHIKNNIGDAKNLLFFIGYCAEGTLGSQLANGKTPVNIFGEPYNVRAKVVSMDTYSGHADKNELRQYVQKLGGNLRKIFCIHGEEDQCLAHAETLRTLKPQAQVNVPKYQEAFDI